MMEIIHNLDIIFAIFAIITMGLGMTWIILETGQIKYWFFSVLGLAIISLILSLTIKPVNTYKFATTDIITGTLIQPDGTPQIYYRWNDFILPNSVASYLNADSITMIETISSWVEDKSQNLTLIVNSEKFAKPKPVDIEPTDLGVSGYENTIQNKINNIKIK